MKQSQGEHEKADSREKCGGVSQRDMFLLLSLKEGGGGVMIVGQIRVLSGRKLKGSCLLDLSFSEKQKVKPPAWDGGRVLTIGLQTIKWI